MADWEADSPQLAANLTRVLTAARDLARSVAPSSELMRQWHTDMLTGLTAPDPSWVGRFRGEAGLEHIAMYVMSIQAAPPETVAAELERFDTRLAATTSVLDSAVTPEAELTADQLSAVIDLCAWAHAEWVRIHPFANGNGRTARLWANAVAMRYGLPPFITLRPRPKNGYIEAAEAAMVGDWQATIPVFRSMLHDALNQHLSDPDG